jgi:hypothetical protein
MSCRNPPTKAASAAHTENSESASFEKAYANVISSLRQAYASFEEVCRGGLYFQDENLDTFVPNSVDEDLHKPIRRFADGLNKRMKTAGVSRKFIIVDEKASKPRR